MRRLSEVLAAIIIAVCVMSVAGSAHALCMYDGKLYAKTTLNQEFRDAALVIKGEVVSVQYVKGADDPDMDPADFDVVRVDEVFKGKAPLNIHYFTWHNSGGFYLDVGKEYLLFLTPVSAGSYRENSPAGFEANYNCGQSREWAAVKAAELAQLRRLSAAKH